MAASHASPLFLLPLLLLLSPLLALSAAEMSRADILASTSQLQGAMDDMLLSTDEKDLDINAIKDLLKIQEKIDAINGKMEGIGAAGGGKRAAGSPQLGSPVAAEVGDSVRFLAYIVYSAVTPLPTPRVDLLAWGHPHTHTHAHTLSLSISLPATQWLVSTSERMWLSPGLSRGCVLCLVLGCLWPCSKPRPGGRVTMCPSPLFPLLRFAHTIHSSPRQTTPYSLAPLVLPRTIRTSLLTRSPPQEHDDGSTFSYGSGKSTDLMPPPSDERLEAVCPHPLAPELRPDESTADGKCCGW